MIWDVATGTARVSLPGRTGRVLCATFSPDERWLATGIDRTIFVWDAATGKEVLQLRGHKEPITSLDYSPDGQRLASSSNDGTVRVWDVRPLDDPPGGLPVE